VWKIIFEIYRFREECGVVAFDGVVTSPNHGIG